MKKSCDYCDATIPNKNKQFCNMECMTNYMRLKDCMMCYEKYEPDEGYELYCSKTCYEKQNIHRYIHNVECALGYGMHGPYFSHELIEVKFKVRNKETGELIEGRVGSRKEELDKYDKEH